MFRLNDAILLLVIFLSMLAGFLLPRFGSLFQPYVLYFMMFFLFLSFLSIKINTIWCTIRQSFWTILFLSFLKTIALPIGVYFLFSVIYPAYAIAALLLSGISTGVVAPFISNLLRANSPLVLVMVVITSLVVPFTLPAMIYILLERSIELSITPMIRMLSLVIFVPILAVETLRRLRPGLIKEIMNRQFPVSLVTFSLINLGVFSQYAEFFYQKPSATLGALLAALMLSAIYLVVGVFSLSIGSLENQLAAGISLGNINNVLIIVFSSKFFGPLEPTVAAMYMVPFFGFILPLRIYRYWRLNQKSPQ
jgi:bile acid:Na+ symporter, BASS family